MAPGTHISAGPYPGGAAIGHGLKSRVATKVAYASLSTLITATSIAICDAAIGHGLKSRVATKVAYASLSTLN